MVYGTKRWKQFSEETPTTTHELWVGADLVAQRDAGYAGEPAKIIIATRLDGGRWHRVVRLAAREEQP